MSWVYFSERGPKCMRFSLRMSNFRLSISVLRESSSACCITISALNDCTSSVLRSGNCCAVRLDLSAACISQLFHTYTRTRYTFETFPDRNVLYGNSGGTGANGPPPIDPFEQHGQLRPAQRHRSFFRLWPDESSTLQPFREQAKSVAVPPKQFDQVAPASAEDEDVARIRILLQGGLRQRAKPSETAAEIRDAGGNPDVRSRWQTDHRTTRSKRARRFSLSTAPSMRIRALPNSTTITPEYSFAGGCPTSTTSAIRTGTNSAAAGLVSSCASRYSFRQWKAWFALTWCCRAITATDASGCS